MYAHHLDQTHKYTL